MVRRKIRLPMEDRVLYAVTTAVLSLFVLAVLYPIVYVISASFSSGAAVSSGRVVLWPVDFGIQGYRAVFSHKHIVSGYANTILYTVAGTLVNLAVTLTAAYSLSRRDYPLRRPLMVFCMITMFFSGGLIPSYLLMVNLHILDTVWVMILPGALSVYNMILTRTSMMAVPEELREAAFIDGCSDAQYFFRILLPLSKAITAVITLFYAVGHWNSYFGALLYLSDPKRYPLQLILRDILISNKLNLSDIEDAETMLLKQNLESLLKYSLIVVSSAPIIAVYPFIQKYFVKGVMLGSIKG